MGFEEKSEIESVEVLSRGNLLVKIANRVLRDGEEISKKYFRYVVDPGDSLEGREPLVVALANAAWPIIFPDGIPPKDPGGVLE